MTDQEIRFEIGRAYNRANNAATEFWMYADDAPYERAMARAAKIEALAEKAVRTPTEAALAKIVALVDRHVRVIANALRRDGYQFADPDECDEIIEII